MSVSPRLKPGISYTILPSEGVLLMSEESSISLRGEVFSQLVPLLNGQHTVDDIFMHLPEAIPAVEIFKALTFLQREGLVMHVSPSIPPQQAAFWGVANMDLEDTERCLKEMTVSVVAFGSIDPAPFQNMLASLGLNICENGERWVVLVDDYLRDELEAFNREALAAQRPWLLVKPVGTSLWIGPLFQPGETGCWACLAQRLRGARKTESFLEEKLGAATSFSSPLPVLPSTFLTGLSIAATETAKWIVGGRNKILEGHIVTLDTLTLAKDTHRLVKRPQCPYCGDPQIVAAGQFASLDLKSCKKELSNADGHFDRKPEQTWKKLSHHISPLTGIVHTLRPTTEKAGEHSLIPSYATSHNFVYVAKDDSLDLDFLNASLQGGSSGKGKHPMQAKVGALCESIERYSGVFQADEARVRATYDDLAPSAILPNACMLYSERQLQHRDQWNRNGWPSTWVPEEFDEGRKIEWSPVWSLTHGKRRFVPTAYCYYGYSRKHKAWFARSDANGCAAGESKEEAILHGFMELVERDGVALWWYNRLKRPAVTLSSFPDPYFQELQTYYHTLHRDFWVLDITSDLNIPTFVAVSCQDDQERAGIILGFGAHFDPQIAILSALTELNLQLPLFSSVMSQNDNGFSVHPRVISWWKAAKLEDYPILTPAETVVPERQEDYSNYDSDNLYTDVMNCVQLAKEKGLETLVLDQTRPDIGLHVVKVIVPGLRHFWPRFGPGRLYDVPVQMGWLTKPLSEDQLNSQPLYLSFQA